jgi:hypothetical protein
MIQVLRRREDVKGDVEGRCSRCDLCDTVEGTEQLRAGDSDGGGEVAIFTIS